MNLGLVEAGPRLPDFAILGVRVMQPGARAAVALGIVDTGAGFSAITPSAAQLLKAQAGQQAVTGYNILYYIYTICILSL